MELLKKRIPTGCISLDRFLGDGLQPEQITLLYGEAETGKTSLAIQCAVNASRMGYKTLFIDSDYTFSPKRFSQIASHDGEEVSKSIILVKPSSFREQVDIIDHLDRYLSERFGLVIVDTVTSLYRAELGDAKKTFTLNRELNQQVATLAQISKTHGVSILLTSQVRSVLEQGKTETEPVATRVLKFWSDTVIRLRHTSERRVIEAIIEKRFGTEETSKLYLTIEDAGIIDHIR